MAHEVMQLSKPCTTAADLWSLGVCIVDFMLGLFPYGGDLDLEEEDAVRIVKKIEKEMRSPGSSSGSARRRASRTRQPRTSWLNCSRWIPASDWVPWPVASTT